MNSHAENHPSENSERAHRTSLTTSVRILECLIGNRLPLGVTQIASSLSLPKSSAHDLLRNLCELGFVYQVPDSKCYTVSPQIFRFIHRFSTQFGHNPKIDHILRETARLYNHTIYLSMISGGFTYVIYATGPCGDTPVLGSEAPVYASSCGKALVATMPQEEWRKFAPRSEDTPLTQNTITSEEEFLRQLSEAVKTGVAYNLGESMADIFSIASAIPVLSGIPSTAVAFVLPQPEVNSSQRDKWAIAIRELAQQIGETANPALYRRK